MGLHAINLNASKTVLARKISQSEVAPILGEGQIGCILDPGEFFRFLGTDISFNAGKAEQKAKILEIFLNKSYYRQNLCVPVWLSALPYTGIQNVGHIYNHGRL